MGSQLVAAARAPPSSRRRMRIGNGHRSIEPVYRVTVRTGCREQSSGPDGTKAPVVSRCPPKPVPSMVERLSHEVWISVVQTC